MLGLSYVIARKIIGSLPLSKDFAETTLWLAGSSHGAGRVGRVARRSVYSVVEDHVKATAGVEWKTADAIDETPTCTS